MPVSYHIDTALRVVFTRATGRISYDMLLAHQDRLRNDPAFDQIDDLSEVTDSTVSEAAIGRLVEINPFLPSVRRAFVTDTEPIRSLVATFLSLADVDAEQVRIFGELAAARQWLYLPQV